MFLTKNEISQKFNDFLKTNQNETVRKLFDKYKDNQELLQEVFSDLYDEITEELNPFKYDPVTPVQFIEDPYYCGKNSLTGEGVCETMYSTLKEDFCKVHDLKSDIREVICSGSIGYGKSYFMSLGLVWNLYILSCLKNPQAYFKLSPASKIAIMIISITEKQAKKNMFSNCKDMVKKIPYFKENYYFDEKRASESLVFPENVELFSGTSSQSSTIGLNIYSAALDEANFFKVIQQSKRARESTGEFDEALTLYYSLLRRQESRFLKQGLKPGILYLGSSNVYPDDFTAKRIKAAKDAQSKTTYIMSYSQWSVCRDKYGTEEFTVELGGMMKKNRILEGYEEDVTGETLKIPMEFYDAFKKDIDNALRDMAGLALYSVQPFFGEREKVQAMFDPSLPKVFSVDTATLSPKHEYVVSEKIIKHDIFNKKQTRYIGLDIGLKKDKFGFCVAENSNITMDDGKVKKIQDINVGDKVIDLNGNSKSVLNKFDNGYKQIYIVKVGNTELKLTGDHKLLILKKTSIFKYDRVILPKTKKYNETVQYIPEWVEVKDITPGDYVISPKFKFEENLDMDYEMAWLYGIYLAEGSTVRKENKICFSLNINETEYANRIIELIGKYFNGHCFIQELKDHNCMVVKSHILKKFENYITDGAINKHIKSEFFRYLNKNQIRGLLDGMFDGDGNECEKTRIVRWTTISINLANQIFSMLKTLGYIPHIQKEYPPNSKNITYRIFLCGCDYYKWKNIKKDTMNRSKHFIYDNNIFYRIDKVSIGNVEKVWDIEVEDTHSYLLEGFIAHNCMGHISEIKVMERQIFNDLTGQMEVIKEKLPVIVIDMLLSIVKEKEFGEVELQNVVKLIFSLKKFGYKIRYSSADGFQSKHIEQVLKRNGINHEYISMDKTTEPYETFRSAVYDGRIKCPYNQLLEQELVRLEKDYVNNKIDHPSRGSKDLADAVGQVVYNCHINTHFFDDSLLPSTSITTEDKELETYEDVIKNFEKWNKIL